MLTLMTLAHLPRQAQVITNQQLGFVSEAEGFVFLSAFLTGRILTEPVMKGISAISFSSFELRGQEDDGQSPACYGLFERIASESGFPTVIKRLWTRALRLYGYHLLLLGIAFTAVATVAIHTERPGVHQLRFQR
jgi:hypothetical protein